MKRQSSWNKTSERPKNTVERTTLKIKVEKEPEIGWKAIQKICNVGEIVDYKFVLLKHLSQ
nr:hypothetical protein [Mycoplasmopsis bovis]